MSLHPSSSLYALVITALLSSACGFRSTGGDEESGTSSTDFAGNRQDVSGSITSQTGSQTQMKSWALAFIERDSSIARVAEADASGVLKFSKVSLAAIQTLVLLSPDYLIQSVLSMPSTNTTVKQYFQLNGTSLPRLIQRGGIINFQTQDGLTAQTNTATDTDGDGIPDGVSSLGLTDWKTFGLLATDTDQDGISNDVDADVDGDGLLNVFDSDDDGDGILDVIDADANGDGIADVQQRIGDQYFATGLEYVAVQYVVTSSDASLLFVAKVRNGITPQSVKIRGASSLLSNSTYTKNDATTAAWDLSLADDGNNDDSASGDSLYARNVTLASGVAPRSSQAVFFQLVMGEGNDQFTAEYPYTFPSLTPTIPTTSYDSSTRTVTLAGDPFGADVQGFVWTVSIKNSSGTKVYEGSAVTGTTRTFVIPSNVMTSGNTYTYRASAQLLDKVAGYPSMVVRSDEVSITP